MYPRGPAVVVFFGFAEFDGGLFFSPAEDEAFFECVFDFVDEGGVDGEGDVVVLVFVELF